MMIFYDNLQTDFGNIHVSVNEMGVCKIAVTEDDWQLYNQRNVCQRDGGRCTVVIRQLQEYLAGNRQQFNVPTSIEGTEFYRQVWRELYQIPYGHVKTYGDIAAAVERPKAYRAVGLANYHNPLPIIIPCHRVIGKDGRMIGYKGNNISIKRYLLCLERGIES